MYDGWLMFGGNEVINTSRTMAYAASLKVPALRDCYECDGFAAAIDDPAYTTPAADGAPWYDADMPESADFVGFYPLELQNFTDSSRTAEVSESINDGGFTSRPREASKEMRVRGLVIGRHDAAAEIGLSWLKTVLRGSGCDECDGDDLCFFIDCPTRGITEYATEAETDAVVDRYIRHMRNVVCTRGVETIRTRTMTNGSVFIEVDFILTATTPALYGEPKLIATAEGSTLTAVTPGALIAPMTTMPKCTYVPSVLPLVDPDCAPVPAPPTVPSFAAGCSPEPASFFSYSILVPKEALSTWLDAVPILEIRTGAQAVRHVRIRVIPRVPETGTPASLDPCTACSAFVINYIPASTVTVIDGMTERITMQRSNSVVQSAEHLVTGVGSDVFEWPVLSCGIGYYIIVDVDVNSVIGLKLSTATKE